MKMDEQSYEKMKDHNNAFTAKIRINGTEAVL